MILTPTLSLQYCCTEPYYYATYIASNSSIICSFEQGNAIYAEIPGDLATEKSPLVQQDKIYIISRFKVTTSKSVYRPVDAKYMIEFTCYTTILLAETLQQHFQDTFTN